jgi:hypothetical protein
MALWVEATAEPARETVRVDKVLFDQLIQENKRLNGLLDETNDLLKRATPALEFCADEIPRLREKIEATKKLVCA